MGGQGGAGRGAHQLEQVIGVCDRAELLPLHGTDAVELEDGHVVAAADEAALQVDAEVAQPVMLAVLVARAIVVLGPQVANERCEAGKASAARAQHAGEEVRAQ